MTVAQNVAFGLNIRKVEGAERDRRVMEVLEAVQMGGYAARKPNQLSGGQQQRIALARALVIRPDVLLLDEPLSNLDAKLRIDLRSEIRRICKQSGITGVYVTHDQKEALSMADRIAIVSKGRIVQVGAPGELYRHPATAFVAEFLGETNFLDGTVLDRQGERITVQTSAGRLVSTRCSPNLKSDAQDVIVSVRPEAFRINAVDGPNPMTARVVSSTYLGETAQLAAELQGGSRIKISQLNPAGEARAGEHIKLSVDHGDTVVLPKSA